MANLNQFAKNMDALAARIESNAIALTQKIALDLEEGLVIGTPIDKGTAKSNFIIKIGAPATHKRNAFVLGKKGSTAEQNIQAAMNAAVVTLAAYTGESDISIANNLLYIQPLNRAHSKQARPGYIEAIISAVRKTVKFYKLTEGKIEWRKT